MSYVDGFVLTVPKDRIADYKRMARLASKVWMEHGALEYRECVGDDMATEWGVTFPKMAKAKLGEMVVFAWIVYKSRAHRDRVNAKVMKDPRMSKEKFPGPPPFDMKRMAYGGFKTLVEA
jgi:uncharacterized protein YbaA (DUF1428 family)